MALPLTKNQQYALAGIARSDGYEAILDILEKNCQTAETNLLRMDALKVSGEAILQKQAECRGARIAFEALQSEVEYQIGELKAESAQSGALRETQPVFS